ncbi:MAG: hypothetical protein IKY53_02140, partial [Lachnospiraceae bacterium]|nr:hypothetical protein [Lachnospiraceae bacterium]
SLLLSGLFLWAYSYFGEGITVFMIVPILGLILHLFGLGFITTYHNNVKLTKRNQTAKFVKERQEEE